VIVIRYSTNRHPAFMRVLLADLVRKRLKWRCVNLLRFTPHRVLHEFTLRRHTGWIRFEYSVLTSSRGWLCYSVCSHLHESNWLYSKYSQLHG